MKVEIKLVPDDGQNSVGGAHVEVHSRRGDAFIVERTDVVGGDAKTLLVPSGGRVIVNTPLAIEKPIYDREQGASVFASQQSQSDTGADKVVGSDVIDNRERPNVSQRQVLDLEIARLPGNQTDPDYVVGAMRQHFGPVFTDADERTVRAKVVKAPPAQGMQQGATPPAAGGPTPSGAARTGGVSAAPANAATSNNTPPPDSSKPTPTNTGQSSGGDQGKK